MTPSDQSMEARKCEASAHGNGICVWPDVHKVHAQKQKSVYFIESFKIVNTKAQALFDVGDGKCVICLFSSRKCVMCLFSSGMMRALLQNGKFLDRGGVRNVDEKTVEIMQVKAEDQKGNKGQIIRMTIYIESTGLGIGWSKARKSADELRSFKLGQPQSQ